MIRNSNLGVSNTFTASQSAVEDGSGEDAVKQILPIAKENIERKEFDTY